jgi:hypothetical protein
LLLAAVAALVLVLAWLLSNLRDAEPVASPAALALAPPRLADTDNSFFALLGLNAAPGRDPAAVGRARWQSQLAFAALPRRERLTQPEAARGEAANEGTLPRPQGAPFVCEVDTGDCTAHWIANADALDRQRRMHVEFGQRCDQWAITATQFEERLPPFHGSAVPLAPHLVNVSSCATWLLSGAALSWARGRKTETVVQLEQAARVSRALTTGSRSLLGHMVALSIGRRTLETLAALALRDRTVAVTLSPALARWPEPTAGIRSWIPSEAAFQRGAIEEMSDCPVGAVPPQPGEASAAGSITGTALAWLCRHQIGWHPNRMRSAIDQHWLHLLSAIEPGLPDAIAQLRRESTESAPLWSRLAWTNTLGQLALEPASPLYIDYLVRHADLALHREMVLLAMAAQQQGVAPSDRASWAAQQPLSALARGRIAWEADGSVLSARTWQSELPPGSGAQRRSAIRIVWPDKS